MPTKLPSKVVLGWLPSPLGGMSLLQQGFVDSIISFLSHDTNPDTGRQIFGGYTTASAGYIPSSRCLLVEAFLEKTSAEWLLMLDWDITFKPTDVYKLIDYVSDDPTKVVSGCYVTYFGDGNLLRPCWFASKNGQDYIPVTDFRTDEMVPLTVTGMGFTLMHRKLLEKMKAKYKNDPWPWFGHDIIGDNRVGEDLTFCTRARKCGATIWGHGGVLLGHTKAKMLLAEDMMDVMYARSSRPETAPRPGSQTLPKLSNTEKNVLNVGCGFDRVLPDQYKGWHQHTLDIDPKTLPDIQADGRDIAMIADESYDGVFCSHNLEHYPSHDVGKVLKGFYRVLKPRGKVEILTPDLVAVMSRVVEEKLDVDDELYVSPAGPITARDVIYGYQEQQASSGEDFFAHRSGFSKRSLKKALSNAGFTNIKITSTRKNTELQAIGYKPDVSSMVKMLP
jgi:SAM-dependent methyltransferase